MIERRFARTSVRAASDSDSPGTIVGYASVFYDGTPRTYSEDLGGFVECVMPGAFDRSLANGDDVRALLNHDASRLLGRTKNKTLRLSTDNIGLRCEIDLPNTSDGRDAWELVRRNTMGEMSFAFTVEDQSWDNEGDLVVRRLKSVKLMDVSAVTYPAYPATSVSVSGKPGFFNSLARGFEQLFPSGVPVEVRSRVQQINLRTSQQFNESNRRQRSTRFILGL